jgi:hypothetical protein
METDEDVDLKYEEKKQQLLSDLVKAIEKKQKIDEAESLYTKEFTKLFEAYRKKKAVLAESILKQKKEPEKGFLQNMLSPMRLFHR